MNWHISEKALGAILNPKKRDKHANEIVATYLCGLNSQTAPSEDRQNVLCHVQKEDGAIFHKVTCPGCIKVLKAHGL